ncbi:hypothetical protein SLEP1_g55932 [Rubroshorea leprosula]|uniref:Uncharacterized protein n=1 Tax=Rubroshorea leprosula TaxID=152421 RepID=A0AAV5MI58_9ROSI|nr:hypothetical protein SLEP1_g55932 [Rubroshorea leprosula]
MNFSSFLVKSQDLGLRIFSLNPENPESALLFSLVRRVLLGLNPSAFSAASSPAEFLLLCRRLLLPLLAPVLAGKFWF